MRLTRAAVSELFVEKGGLLGVAVFALYAWLAPTYPLGGDNGEFATLGAIGGVAHPSGYPLYVLWLRAWSWLPTTPAHAAALATALLGAAQVVMLHAAARAWGARAAAATLAAALYAASPIPMLLHSQAEVFAMNGLVAATILWLAAPAGPARGTWRAVLLGLVAGLGLANHLTCSLLAPIGIAGLVVGIRECAGARRRVATAGLAAAAFLVGLVPYAYLFVAPTGGLSWGEVDTLGDLAHHALRGDYGTGSLSAHGAEIAASVNLAPLAEHLARAYWGVFLAAGVAALVIRSVRGPARVRWICLFASILLAGPILISQFDQHPVGVWAWMTERFHHLPLALLVVPVAVGIELALAWIARRAPAVSERFGQTAEPPGHSYGGSGSTVAGRVAGRARLATLAAVLVVPLVAAPSLDHVRRGHSPATDRGAKNLLRSLPPNAVVIASGDDLYFCIGYAQLVDGVRPDVRHIALELMTLPWYRRQSSAELGFDVLVPGPGYASVKLAEAALAHGHALFVDTTQKYILEAFPSYPHGTVIRVLPRGAPVPDIDEVRAINRAIVDGYDLAYPRPHAEDGWSAVVHRRYAKPWGTLSIGFDKLGRLDDAAEAAAIANELGPLP
jgi:hypothetical protein